jgi:hypothetical protein
MFDQLTADCGALQNRIGVCRQIDERANINLIAMQMDIPLHVVPEQPKEGGDAILKAMSYCRGGFLVCGRHSRR